MEGIFEKLNGIVPDIKEIKRRKEHIKKIIVQHPKYISLLTEIEELHIMSGDSVQADGLFLYGETGVGKSTILREYRDRFSRYVEEGITKIPILYVKVPVGATPKSVASTFLYEMGDPNFDKGTGPNQTARIINYIEKCEVQMVIIDEFQHLIDRDTQHVLNRASDWVKSFTEDTNIPLIIGGMPESMRIFKHNEQLDRRFIEKKEMLAFSYTTKEDQFEFRAFLHNVDKQLPFTEKSHLADVNIAERIFYVSNGVPFYIKKLIQEASVYAIKSGKDNLSEVDFLYAFQKIRLSKRPHMKNPFNNNEFNLYDYFDMEIQLAKS